MKNLENAGTMDQERWRAINQIFHAALDLPEAERSTFVAGQAKGDAALELEIERLLEADRLADDYLESPILGRPFSNAVSQTAPPVREGDLISGRFRIHRMVGEGGMGHVFEAFDHDLGVVIALKVIRTEIAGNTEALARFRQEVRLAHTITHPNVCRTYDINRDSLRGPDGQTRELVYLTMEYLPGETLAARIRREGALPLGVALSIAHQLARALTSAHTIGVIHRDIKPANVMLVTEGPSATHPGTPQENLRAVITDFGLARLDHSNEGPETSAITRSFRPMGTLAYMAPEQLKGLPASTLTDVYAFGLVLFEMATGQRAFPVGASLTGIAARVAGPPPSTRKILPSLPEPWHRGIEGSLYADPRQRWQNPTEVVLALEGRSPRQRFSLRFAAWMPHSHQLIVAIILIFGFAVSLFFASPRIHEYWGDSSTPAGALVYVTHVRNETTEKSFESLTELVQAGLTQSAHINLLEESRVGDLLQQMTKPPDTVIDEPIAREIALRVAAPRVVFLRVTGSGGSYALEADIQEPDANTLNHYRHHWTKRFPWHSSEATNTGAIPAELLTAVRDTTDWIRHEVGESRNDIAALDVPSEGVTTGNWEALRDYSEADKLSRQNQLQAASVALTHAIQLDPNFALAYARLGDVLLSLGRDSDGYKMYDKSLARSQFSRLTRKEEDRIRGMRAVDTMDFQAAADAFHDYTIYYPNDYRGWAYLTLPLRMLGRDPEAATSLARAIKLDPTQGYGPFALAQELMILGRFDEVPQWLSHLEKYGHQELADDARASLLLIQGHFDEASTIFRNFTNSPSSSQRSYSYRELASVAAEQGNLAEAITDLDKGLNENDTQSDTAGKAATLIDRAYLKCRLGQFKACLGDVHEGFTLNPTPHLALAADTVLGLAATRPRASEKSAAITLLNEVARAVANTADGKVTELATLRTQGEIELARGQLKQAVETFEKTSAQDAPAQSKEYLARALTALAATQSSPAQKQNTLEYAANLSKQFTRSPAHVYLELTSYPPGFYNDLRRSQPLMNSQ